MKKFISLFVALAMVLSLFAGVGARTAKAAITLPGDVNFDGTVTMTDALLAARAAVGITTLTGDAFLAADYNQDGAITMPDVLLIARIAVGLTNPITVTAITAQTVAAGATVAVPVTATPTHAIITASSSAIGTATVAVTGSTVTVTGVAEGAATITVTAAMAGYTSITATFVVTVTPPPVTTVTVTATPATMSLLVGANGTIVGTPTPTDATVTFASDTPAIATVGATTGVVTAVAAGTAIITVTAAKTGYTSGTATVTVTVTPTVAVTVGSPTLSLAVGATGTIVATPTPIDATVTFASDTPAIATVDATTGVVTAVAAGTAIITVTAAKTGYTSGTATVTVTVTPFVLSVVSVKAIDFATSAVLVAALDGSTVVPTNAKITITFNEALDPTTVNINTVRLLTAIGNVPQAMAAPTISTDLMTITLAKPVGAALAPNTQYKVSLAGTVANAAGTRTLGAETVVATFTTLNTGALVNFQNDAGVNVAYLGNIVAADVQNGDDVFLVFDQDIDATTISNATVKLRDTAAAAGVYEAVLVSRSAANTVDVKIQNVSGLTAGHTYEVTFNGLRTISGTDVVNGSWKFVAAGTAPTVAALTTLNNENIFGGAVAGGWGKLASGTLQDGTVKNGLKFMMTFATDLDQSTLSSITLRKVSTDTAVAATLTYDSGLKRVDLVPTADLEENTAYVVKATTALKSSVGLPLAATYTSSTFTTYDLTRPTVVSVTDAAHNFISLPIGLPTTFTVVFSEAVTEYDMLAAACNALTLTNNVFANNASVLARNLTGNVVMTNNPPVLSMSGDNKTLSITVTPAAGEENRTFEVSFNAKDGTNAYLCDSVNAVPLQRNSIASDYSFTFTSAGTDATPPTVQKVYFGTAYSYAGAASTSGVKGVSAAKNMYVIFSELMANTGADVTTFDDTGAIAGDQNVELYTKAIGADWVLDSPGGSHNGGGAGFIRFANDNTNLKSYMILATADIIPDTQYKLVFKPAALANGIEDLAGNDMASSWEFEFTTTGGIGWTPVIAGTVLGANYTTAKAAIAAGAGVLVNAFETTADMNPPLTVDDVVALEMSDHSFYFEQIDNALIGADTSAAGASGTALAANLPVGTLSLAAGNTIINMDPTTGVTTSFAALAGGYPVGDPIAFRIDAVAGAPVDTSTVTTSNIKLVKVTDSTEIPYALYFRTIGNCTYVSLNPTASLENSTTYEVQVSGIKDQIGNTMTAKTSRFTTAAATPDSLEILATSPADNDVAVAVNAAITVTFNEDVTIGSGFITTVGAVAIAKGTTSAVGVNALAVGAPGAAATTVALADITDGTWATGRISVSADGKTVTIIPDAFLIAGKLYQIQIGGGLSSDDLAGADTILGAQADYSFTTEATASVSPKLLTARYVDTNAGGINAGDKIIFTLNTPLATVTNINSTVAAAAQVGATWNAGTGSLGVMGAAITNFANLKAGDYVIVYQTATPANWAAGQLSANATNTALDFVDSTITLGTALVQTTALTITRLGGPSMFFLTNGGTYGDLNGVTTTISTDRKIVTITLGNAPVIIPGTIGVTVSGTDAFAVDPNAIRFTETTGLLISQ